MKSLYFSAVLLGLSVSWLGRDSALANHNISEENVLISQTPAKVETFIGGGAEPFWDITVNRNGIVYSSPDYSSSEISKRTYSYPYVAPIKAEGRPLDVVRVYRLNGQPNGILIIKKTDSCSDSMSDKVYPYQATLILGNRVMEGCAERK
ncbi:MAG: hypothetical protein WBV73_03665 [Phormidium sp.]